MWKTGLSQCGKYLEHLEGKMEECLLRHFWVPDSLFYYLIYESHTVAPNYRSL